MSLNIEEFTDYLASIYPNNYKEILKYLSTDKPKSFRINRLKANEISILGSLKSQGFNITKGPIENSYIVIDSNNQYLSDSNEFKNGLIYIQRLESMLPVNLLVKHGFTGYLLDIAAAPGSKTTQAAEISQNKSRILAIDKNYNRVKSLKNNIKAQDAKDIKIITANGIKFDKRNTDLIDFFDKAIVDVPCSSEGRFNLSNYKTTKYWHYNKRKDISKIQKGLLISAYRMLKPGGELIYSTCTLGVEENEMVIDWLLDKITEAEIVKVDLDIPNIVPGFINYKDKKLNSDLSKTIRILPNNSFGGFYIAKVRKGESPNSHNRR